MSRVESLESIETSLRGCRDISSSIGESMLTYMIDMAIADAARVRRSGAPTVAGSLGGRVFSHRANRANQND